MRLFIAVDLDDAARASIAAVQQRIAAATRDERSRVTWVKPDRMHLTLVFLGEVEAAGVPRIVAAVERPVDAPPFDMALETIGTFPSTGAPRAIWVGVGAGAVQLTGLHADVARRIGPLGLALESRPFHPHLTLGRWKSSRPSDRRKALAAASAGVIARTRVDCATLYHSQLSSEGPTYTPLARATLSVGL